MIVDKKLKTSIHAAQDNAYVVRASSVPLPFQPTKKLVLSSSGASSLVHDATLAEQDVTPTPKS